MEKPVTKNADQEASPGSSMNRRQVIKTVLTATAGASLLLSGNAFGKAEKIQRALSKPEIAEGNTLYISPSGSDNNPGTKDKPLRNLSAAAAIVNSSKGSDGFTVIITEGVYALNEKSLFTSDRFTQDARLTIRAEVLPDDPAWLPVNMPVLICTMPLSPNWIRGMKDPFGGVNYGMQFEMNHVTVQGLKILGAPIIEKATERAIRRIYPIGREGADFKDLLVKQCLFVGNREVTELHCAVLGQGDSMVIDHCVFYGVKIAAVYWKGKSTGSAMTNTLMINNYVCGPWICAVGDDFDYNNNVTTGNRSAVLFQGPIGKYNLKSSLFAGNTDLYSSGGGPPVNYKTLPSTALALPDSSKVTDKHLEIEFDQSKRTYLHVVSGTPGSEAGAGLFTKV